MSQYAWGSEQTRFFFELTPEKVLGAVESLGFVCTGRCMALNSMENRVYEIEIEVPSDAPLKSPSERFRVAKFYRPGRWSQEQILEEHEFLLDLQEDEVPVVAPLRLPDPVHGPTLHQMKDSGIWFALFQKMGGRSVDELNDTQVERLGRLLGRIHAVGARKKAQHRIELTPTVYGTNNLEFLLSQKMVPADLEARYCQAVEKICVLSAPWFAHAMEKGQYQRIHGDCHFGNILWNDRGPFFLDFDDCVRGPCVQDLWLVQPGRDEEARRQFAILLEAYEQMRDFDRRSLRLIEPLRALRFVHFSAWIAKRWDDASFPAHFPHFGTHKYWQEQVADLEDQLSLIENADVSSLGGYG